MGCRLTAETKINISPTAIRLVERAAAYVQSEVEKRSGWRWRIVKGNSPGSADVVLGIAGDGSPESPLMPEYPEEITLWAAGDHETASVYALAGGPSVAMAMAGKLVRVMKLTPGAASLPSLSLRERPAFPVRGHLYANHKQNNTYDKWSYAHWEEYLTEMASWGDNIALFLSLHPTRWAGSLPFDDEPWFDSVEREKEFQRQLEIQLRLPGLCHELGMRYGIWLPVNDIFPEEVKRHPELTKYGGAFVCPHIPEARKHIRALRERLFSMLPAIDILFLPSFDDGGCPGCEQCTPWAPVYVELVKEQATQVRRHHPDCRLWLAQQGLSAGDAEVLMAWLDQERPEWVEGVACGPFSEVMTFNDGAEPDSRLSLEEYPRSGAVSGAVNRLRAILPGQYQLILYPDETHTYRCQYPVVGMDPVVMYVWGREDGPAPRIREMCAKHAATSPASDGTAPYSEGDTDDVNKIVWSARSWDPGLTAEEIAHEYAHWFFGPECATDAAELLLIVEEVLNRSLYGNESVKRARSLLDACEAHQLDLLNKWRWLNLRVGVLMLEYIQRVMVRDRELLAESRYRAAVWRHSLDPIPGLRQTIHFLERRFSETAGMLHEIVWTRDRLFEIHRLAIRGVAKLQNSYMKMDVLLEEWRAVLERLERGELSDYPERHKALMAPLLSIESAFEQGFRGVQIVDDLQEFAWEQGKTVWSWQ